MLQDAKAQKAAVAADIGEIADQLSQLREDMVALTRSVAAISERRGRRMAADISEGIGEAVHYVEGKGRGAEAELEKSIATYPYLALGLAAGAGLLVGAMTRR